MLIGISNTFLFMYVACRYDEENGVRWNRFLEDPMNIWNNVSSKMTRKDRSLISPHDGYKEFPFTRTQEMGRLVNQFNK